MLLLNSITYYVTIYLGFLIYIFGFLGSLLNIRILYSNRTNPCTFLSIYSSIVDCFVLNIGLLLRILSVGFDIDPTLTNLIWCKIRTYGLRISTLISLYTICLMSIDQFFISCRTVRWRQMSNMIFIRWTTFFLTLFIIIEGQPFLILPKILQINNSISCTPMYNLIFAKYAYFFCIPILFGLLPLFILIMMGILIYYKLHRRTHLRKAQRTLILIILFRIVFVIISCGPYTSYFVYSAIIILTVPIKSVERIAIENCILSIVSVSLYITYSSSFFIYYFTSSTYRKQFKDLLIYLQTRGRRDIIHPMPMVMRRCVRTNTLVVTNNIEQNETI